MNIKGKIVTLRAIEKKDIDLLHKWSNDPEINYMLGGWHFPSSTEDQEKWYSTLSENTRSQRFAIDAIDQGLIGMANLVDINWKDRNAFHGMLLGEQDISRQGLWDRFSNGNSPALPLRSLVKQIGYDHYFL